MKLGRPVRILLGLFAVVLVGYLASFYGIEYLRHRKGPWLVHFDRQGDGTPYLEISQRQLGIERVRLVFAEEVMTNAAESIHFAKPTPGRAAPFGRVIYEDLTFLPGVVTFDLFGHEIELVPRMLVVNRRSIPWKSAGTVVLHRDEKPAVPPRSPGEHRKPQPPDGTRP